MLNFYQRLGFRYSILMFCCFLVLIGCGSRTFLYYAPTVSNDQKKNVEKLPAEIKYRIILLGDGGKPENNKPIIETLGKWAKEVPKKTTIVFLGDNMYEYGLTKKEFHKANAKLGPQLDVVIESQASGLFIPGNHDWESGGKSGLSTINAQEAFINKKLEAQDADQHPAFLPKKGYPGPERLELPTASPAVRLVVLDTQWWLHKYQKPVHKTPQKVIEELKVELKTELPVIVVGHHPIETYGPHGGHRAWGRKSFNSLKRFVGWHFGIYIEQLGGKPSQNTNGERYKELISQLNEAFFVAGKTSLLIYAAGHDHSLQVLEGNTADYLLVSGAASQKKISEVSAGNNTVFAYQNTGFMVVDFLENGAVLLRVVEPEKKEDVPFHQWLQQ